MVELVACMKGPVVCIKNKNTKNLCFWKLNTLCNIWLMEIKAQKMSPFSFMRCARAVKSGHYSFLFGIKIIWKIKICSFLLCLSRYCKNFVESSWTQLLRMLTHFVYWNRREQELWMSIWIPLCCLNAC